ncbi:MAG: HAMP domain-containing protein [Anaerolineae bacterium]|nr:HAMP domain-containing protein [Anaerolineae bacterium]
MFTSIRWRIVFPYTLIILATTLGLTSYISHQVRNARQADLETRLLAEARLMSHAIVDPLAAADVATLDAQAKQWSMASGDRVTIVGIEGTVLGESHADRETMDNHLYRDEIWQAVRKGQGMAIRFSRTLDADLMYVAVLVSREAVSTRAITGAATYSGVGQPVGVVRVALPLDEIEANISRLSRNIMVAGLVTVLLAIGVAFYIASRTVRPVRELIKVVEDMAEGNMRLRFLATTRDEIGQLMRAFNHMADQLREKVTTLARERSRLSAVLRNMADGVIITSDLGEVILINHAATRMLRTDEDHAVGRSFAQVVYKHQLIELWNRCQQTGKEQTVTVETGMEGLFLQAVATPLHDPVSSRMLIIIRDLTQVRRLETVRRDFISNISHELRTPLASLALVVETLKDGAVDEPEIARHFLTHMETELSALTQMVEELLELSRIESGRVPLDIHAVPVDALMNRPFERLLPQAERAGLTLSNSMPDDLPLVLADGVRIQQVVANLLHNAIKFTPPGGAVTVFAKVEEMQAGEGAEVIIGVTDTGVGISAGDLPRIFERFYKADRARSGGGTGLGLAIAKHIIQGHNGRIWAESIEGVGSTFYFSLPVASSEL